VQVRLGHAERQPSGRLGWPANYGVDQARLYFPRTLSRFGHARRACLLAAVALGGCGGSSRPSIQLSVTPRTSLADRAVDIRLAALAPRERVRLIASARGAGGEWRSEAVLRADRRGRVDVARRPSLGGSYGGVDAMGLFWAMRPPASVPGASPGLLERTTLRAVAAGRSPAVAVVRRQDEARGERERLVPLRGHGFTGYFVSPGQVGRRRPAVVVIGGSEGGFANRLLARLLAAHGYPALAIAYFRAPGLPQTLRAIPLEYFARAARWLATQPGVDPGRVWLRGGSRGAEAALLVAAHYPRLIHGVIAEVPSSVVNPASDVLAPAWSLRGKPLPYVHDPLSDDPSPRNRAAIIPVERIRGPILTVSGQLDSVWNSHDYADAIMARLARHHYRFLHRDLDYPDAGHGVGYAVPYVPGPDPEYNNLGGTRAANAAARDRSWPVILRLLRDR
jgi:dienelactone hydrolase